MANYKSGMDYQGSEEGYQVYKNKEGFMEGYKAIGINKYGTDGGSDVKRITTNQTTLTGFGQYIRGLRKKTHVKDIPLGPSQLPGLPFPD